MGFEGLRQRQRVALALQPGVMDAEVLDALRYRSSQYWLLRRSSN